MNMNLNKSTLKEINQYVIPSMISMATHSIFILLDNMIIARISIDALASIGVANKINFVLSGFLGTLAVAFHILMAQSINTDKGYSQKLFSSIINLAVLIGIGYILFTVTIGNNFIKFFFQLEDNIHDNTVLFLKVTSPTILLNMLIFVFSSYFKNLGHPKIGMKVAIYSILVNIFFDYSLTFGKFGFPAIPTIGVGIGSIIGLAVGMVYFIYKYFSLNLLKYKFCFDKGIIKKIFKYFFPLMGQEFIEDTCVSFILLSLVSSISTSYLASYNLLDSVLGFFMLPIFSYSSAGMTLIALNILDTKKIKSIIYTIAICSFIIIVLCAVMLCTLQKPILHLLTNQIQIINDSSKYIFYICLILISNSFMQNFKYALQALDHAKFVVYYNFIVWSFALVVLYLIRSRISLEIIYVITIIVNLILIFGYFYKLQLRICKK